MKQRTYYIEDRRKFRETLRAIGNTNVVTDSGKTLFIFHESSDGGSDFRDDLEALRTEFPDITNVGITMIAPPNAWMKLPTGIMFSVLTFETSSFDTFLYDCTRMSPEDAADSFSREVSGIRDAKGILLFTSGSTLDPERFLKGIHRGADRIPIFGTQAGGDVSSEDRSQLFLRGRSYSRAILAVVFHGLDLHIKPVYSFGWRPLGREMTITEVRGDGLVSKLDGTGVLDVYYNYLHIVPDKNFYSNICAFPLLVRAGNRITSRVPLKYAENGVYFSTGMCEGDAVSLSYSKKAYLMDESARLSNELLDFRPQAMYASVCINRRVFMGNESADREIDFFRNACPSMLFGCGFGEILRQDGNGGFLNSTFVAVAFREGDAADTLPANAPLPISGKKTDSIPLSERLVTFLEATTTDLRNTIGELQTLASHDKMTGIYNRMTVENLLANHIKQAQNSGKKLSVLLFDIDTFKSINDRYGHAAGDDVLKGATAIVCRQIGQPVSAGDSSQTPEQHPAPSASATQSQLPAPSASTTVPEQHFPCAPVFGRWGGDEFLCVFPDMSEREARKHAEEIRKEIGLTAFDAVSHVTVSMGVAGMKGGDDVQSLMVRADRALYHSKHSGRNQVSVYCRAYENEMETGA